MEGVDENSGKGFLAISRVERERWWALVWRRDFLSSVSRSPGRGIYYVIGYRLLQVKSDGRAMAAGVLSFGEGCLIDLGLDPIIVAPNGILGRGDDLGSALDGRGALISGQVHGRMEEDRICPSLWKLDLS